MEKFDTTEKDLTKTELLEFETKLSVKLPTEFISHYLINNGGFPAFNYLNGRDEVFSIDGFIPVKYGAVTIESLLIDFKNQGIVFEQKIPFANDAGGNLFFLFFDKENYGKIFLWDAESDVDEPDSYFFVTDTFAEFLEGLTNEEPEDE